MTGCCHRCCCRRRHRRDVYHRHLKTWPCKPAVSWSDLAGGLDTPCFGLQAAYFGSENERVCKFGRLRFGIIRETFTKNAMESRKRYKEEVFM